MRTQRQLRGLFDDMMAIAKEVNGVSTISEACVSQASSSMANFDANIEDVTDNWKPTNFYRIDQVRQIFQFGLEAIGSADNLIKTASEQLQLPSHREVLFAAHEELFDSQAMRDSDAIKKAIIDADQQARASGRPVIIEAPGFKRWVINVLKACRRARFICSAIACSRPGILLGAVAKLDAAAQLLINTAKLAVNVVKTAVDIVVKIPDLLSTVFKILGVLPWFVLVGGGYYVATKTVLPPKYDPLKLRDRDTWRPWRKKPGLEGHRSRTPEAWAEDFYGEAKTASELDKLHRIVMNEYTGAGRYYASRGGIAKREIDAVYRRHQARLR